MEKSILEQRIGQRALEQTNREYREFIEFMVNNKFAKSLKIKVNDKNIPLAKFGYDYSLLNFGGVDNKTAIEFTNLQDVYDKLRDENIKKETDTILKKLETINYLFE